MNREGKDIVEDLMDVAAQAAGGSKNPEGQERKIRKLEHREILHFLLYLSASDGSIETDEADFIYEHLGERMSPEEMCGRIEAEDIYSTDFEERAPVVLKKLVKFDNAMYRRDGTLEESQAEKYIRLYEKLGRKFAACDREVSQREKSTMCCDRAKIM